MKRRLSIIGAMTGLILLMGSPSVRAQLPDEPTAAASEEPANAPFDAEETITLRVGDVFEIAADPGTQDATYSWILTQERTFIEAGRDRLFRYRFVQSNEYILRADVVIGSTGERRQKTLKIDVQAQSDVPAGATYPAGTGASIAGVLPAPDTNGRIVLRSDQRVIQLTPIRTDVSPIALDLDAQRDTDGDGNPGNDIDDTDTYFHTYGRPLWVWIARPLTQVEITVTAVPQSGSPLVQRITVLSEEAARDQGVLTSAVSIASEKIDDATFGFKPSLARPTAGDAPLLYEWDFGDGERSLETEPVHAYATSDTFTVRLQVRDLGTGNTVGTAEALVSATVGEPAPEEPVVTPPEEPVVTPPEEPTQTSALPWGRYLLFGGIFALSLLIGIVVVWLLSFLRKSRTLEQTLESMEQAVAPSKEQAPAPLAIKSKPQPAPTGAAQQKVIDAEINASTPGAKTVPTVNEASAPDWLKKGLASDKPAAAVPPASPPVAAAPKLTAVPPAAAPKPAPSTAAPTQPKAAPAGVPPAQTTPPKPAATQEPPAPNPANLPRWLQPTSPAPSAPVQPAQAPVTPPAKPATPQPAAPSITTNAPVKTQAPGGATPVTKQATPTPAPTPAAAPATTPTVTQRSPAPAQPATTPAPLPPIAVAKTASAPNPPVPPAPKQVVTPPKPAPAPQAPTQVTPPPVAPTPIPTPLPTPPVVKNDDDRPIAIIRADSIDPGPAK